MWPTFLLAALTASALAAPSPLTTSATTTATLSGLQTGNSHDGILIHVIRTEDLIADKLASKPLLLEKLSHLLIRVELGNQSVAVNGHRLPVLPGARPLEVSVKLKQVQMLKMPADSPLVPLGLSAPEVVKIADKYMSEGIVAAMLSVTQEPLTVEAVREDLSPVQAEAYQVTIAIKILEVDGMSLAETDLAPIALLHLVVHPDQADPTKVATMTTLAPEALLDPAPSASALPADTMTPAAMLTAALDSTRASLAASLHALRTAMHGMAAHASKVLTGARARKPCHKRPHHHHHHHPHHEVAPKSAVLAAQLAPAPAKPLAHQTTLQHRMGCFVKMLARSALAVLLLGLPLALVFLACSALLSALLRRRLQASLAAADAAGPPAYAPLPADEKAADGFLVVEVEAPDADKL